MKDKEQELARRKQQLALEEEMAANAAKMEAMQRISLEEEMKSSPTTTSPPQQTSKPPDSSGNTEKHLELTRMLLECHMKPSLPQRSIQPFNGDPLNFHSFLRAFEHGIEMKTTDALDRLYFLEQYTRGEPNEIVKSCMYGSAPAEAYTRAKELLKRRFGNKHTVMESMLQKAEAWPDVRSEDAEAMHRYSLFLTQWKNLAMDLDQDQEVDHSHIIKMVINKLPFKHKDRWQSRADSIQEGEVRRITFQDVVTFVNKQARVLNNATYGSIGGTKRDSTTPARPKTMQKGKMLATKATSEENSDSKVKSCLFCESNDHHMDKCSSLSDKPMEDRVNICKSKGVCFGCLKKGHFSRDCKRRLSCERCSKRHPTILHRNEYEQANKDEKETKRNEADEQSQASTGGNETATEQGKMTGNVKCHLTSFNSFQESLPAVVPVIARSRDTGREIETYAFIDGGSNASFCTEELKQKLRCKDR